MATSMFDLYTRAALDPNAVVVQPSPEPSPPLLIVLVAPAGTTPTVNVAEAAGSGEWDGEPTWEDAAWY